MENGATFCSKPSHLITSSPDVWVGFDKQDYWLKVHESDSAQSRTVKSPTPLVTTSQNKGQLHNTLSNAASQLQRRCSHRLTIPCPAAISAALNGTTARIHTVCCIMTVTSTVEWKEWCLWNIGWLFILIFDIWFYKRISINRCSSNVPTWTVHNCMV